MGVNSKNYANNEDAKNSIEYGRWLSHPPEGEEVVISGLSGSYPNSRNVYEFQENLFNTTDMISDDDRRWNLNNPQIPNRTGKLYDIEKFDAGYFGIHEHQAHTFDPLGRLLMEKAVEAILDAGFNPKELEGTKTGVFVGVCFSETQKTLVFQKHLEKKFAITGCIRSMIADRISYGLKLQGQSYIADSACSSSLYALENAYRAIRDGVCDAAIVGTSNLCLHPLVSLQFARLGVLSMDGRSKSFDETADGYARSEAVIALFLQKAKNSRRIYSQIVHAKTNCDGYKEQGITFPSSPMQEVLLKEFYEECQISPTDLTYLEAHGTGTKVGDLEELVAIDNAFDKSLKKTLLIGSVKSNIGHGEPTSGLSAVTKAIIVFETGLIPPNLNYKTPKIGVEALENGRFKVVTETTSLPDDHGLIGINNFGFGGGNAHVLLRYNKKLKVNGGLPKDDLPRLVCVSGREENSVRSILDDIKNKPLDSEYISLFHKIFSKETINYPYRGYSIVSKSGEIKRSLGKLSFDRKPLYLVFSNFGIHWKKIATDLFSVPLFIGSIHRISDILSQFKVNITEILLDANKKSSFDQILGTMAIQIGIADLFKTLKIELNGYLGYGFGELICSYLDGFFDLKDIVITVYKIASNLEDSANELSGSIDVSTETQTDLLEIEEKLKKLLKTIKHKPSKWLKPKSNNTSIVDSFENLKNNLQNEFSENVAILEIGSTQLSAKEFNKNNNLIKFETNDTDNYFLVFLDIVGSLYEMGYNFELDKLYPKVQYPVSRGTPMISPLIKWNHKHNWFVMSCHNSDQLITRQDCLVQFSVKDDNWKFLTGHVIDGRNLFPATGYLYLAWQTFNFINKVEDRDMQLVIENCKFQRATNVTQDNLIIFHISVNKGTGYFEIHDKLTTLVNGKVFLPKDLEKDKIHLLTFNDKLDKEHLELTTKDIYKELRLRGYNYSGAFKKIVSCNLNMTKAYIRWEGNWVAFMDNMIQLKILQSDIRNLYVPTGIRYCSIDFKKHFAYVESFGEKEPNLPVYIYKELDIIRCGGIEIRGLEATSIAKRKSRSDPILEKYVFVPNQSRLNLNDAIRVNMQLLLENSDEIKIKSVEVFNNTNRNDLKLLSPIIYEVLSDLPLIQTNIVILSDKPLNYPNFLIEKKALSAETDCNLVVGIDILQKSVILQQALSVLKPNGFILTRERLDFQFNESEYLNIQCLSEYQTENEKVLLLRNETDFKIPIPIRISNENFDWISQVQNAIKKDSNLVLFSQNEPLSGILGLFNCLQCEITGQKIKCVFIQDQAPQFDINNKFYKKQLKKNLTINVYENSKWGTYRHLLLNKLAEIESEHLYANILVKGDLSSFKWFEGPLTSKFILPPEQELIEVYYSALNFKDVMVATGRISADVITTEGIPQLCIQGFEFSGRNLSGKRVMGLTVNGALSTLTKADKYFMWEVPDHWSLAEAATVPVVYMTVLYPFFWEHKLKRGETVLIHSGTGGIGQAAIHVALHHGCTVYTTVGTEEKREFLKRHFPQLTDKHIGNSRDTSFEQMIFEGTNGRGVDIVLNSLAEEKLIASVRCLAEGGKFFEIGKFDFANNNPLKLMLLEKNAEFHGIFVDKYFTSDPCFREEFNKLFKKALANGYIKPLKTNIFQADKLEKAFRFMTTGKHIGKVLIEIRKEEDNNTASEMLIKKGKSQYYCDSNSSYVICGGLGGFGLEFANWLILRGARNLILSSSRGLSNGYQTHRINIWRSYGCYVKISTADITTKEGCRELIVEANKLAPVAGIYNLAVVLKDGLFENQNIPNFITSFQVKAFATQFLDETSRKLCPNLKDFVVFSSVSCGRGNAGQTNYGMSNSIMERICEKRRQDGLPATAIEWGAVGDVGLVAQMQEENTEIEIGGTLQQRISNCLEVLDVLLTQDSPIVASMVVAEKRGGLGSTDSLIEAVANIIGISDIKTVSLHSTLAEMGMDSMSGVEVKQTLEREFDVFLSASDIRSLTFDKLVKIQEGKSLDKSQSPTMNNKKYESFELLLRIIGDESTSQLPVIEYKTNDCSAPEVIILPGIEGSASGVETLVNKLGVNAVVCQFTNINSVTSVNELISKILPFVEKNISKTRPFNIIAYSYGTFIATEMVSLLEQRGYLPGNLIYIDGSGEVSADSFRKALELGNNTILEIQLFSKIMTVYLSSENIDKHIETIEKYKTFQERIEIISDILSTTNNYSKEYSRNFLTGICNRIEILLNHKTNIPKLKSEISLFKPDQMIRNDLDFDYGLTKLFEKPIKIKTFKGNHVTILENIEMAEAIRKLLKRN